MKNSHIQAAVTRGIDPTQCSNVAERLIDSLLDEVRQVTISLKIKTEEHNCCAEDLLRLQRDKSMDEFSNGYDIFNRKRPMTLFERWCYSPAKWYEFWKSQSGLLGGVFLGSIIGFVLILGYWILI